MQFGITKINRRNKHPRKISITKQIASNIFASPFYFGILIQNDQEVDLREISSFKPMISEDDYNTVQDLGRTKARVPIHSKKEHSTHLDMVYCGVCNSSASMVVGKNRSANGSYGLTYRCDNKECTRKPKSVRAKYFLNDLYTVLDSMKFTELEYSIYSNEIDKYFENNSIKLRTERHSLEGRRKHIQTDIERLSRQLANLPLNAPAVVAKDTLVNDLEELQSIIIDIKSRMASIEQKVSDPTKLKLSKEEFLNLANTAGDKMRAGTPVEKDILAHKMLLNVHLDNERTPSYLWKEPFATLLKSKEINSGALKRT